MSTDNKKGFFKRTRKVEETRSEPLPGVIPPARTTGEPVTVDSALSMSAVYRSVSILSTTVAQLDLGVYANGKETTRKPNLVAQPQIGASASTFLKRTVQSLATTGNAYWRVYFGADGKASSLEVLNPGAIRIAYDGAGRKTYEYNGYRKPKTFQDNEVKHLKLMEPFGSDYGLGPIQAARAELQGHLDLRDYASQWFSNSGIPTGVLSTDNHLDATTADEYRKRWTELQASDRGVAVLGNGLSYSAVLLNPVDAQFIENQQFSTTQVARLFGIPANYLLAAVDGSAMTYSNMQDVDTAFVRYTLMEYIREIEEAFSDLLPRGTSARFKTEGLMRANTQTRYNYYGTAIDKGILTIDEVREMEGLAPLASN